MKELEDKICAFFETVCTIEARRPDTRRAASGQATLAIACAGEAGLPNYRPGGTQAALKALNVTRKKLLEARNSLRNLPSEAHFGIVRYFAENDPELDRFGPELLPGSARAQELVTGLAWLERAADHAHYDLAASRHQPASKGRPRKNMVEAFTFNAAKVFEHLTGDCATRATDWDTGKPSSSFHAFLDKLFKIAGIEANADEQIRKITKYLSDYGGKMPIPAL
jgi:hypothetical protein